jgi:tRNA modification GTPase
VRESFQLGGTLFLLSDTAGIRVSQDLIEAEGINRSLGEVRGSQLILWVIDGVNPDAAAVLSSRYNDLRQENKDAQLLVIFTKKDLLQPGEAIDVSWTRGLALPHVLLSAVSGSGIQELESKLIELMAVNIDEEGFGVGRLRHFELLGRAVQEVSSAIGRVGAGDVFPDLLAGDLRAALSALGEITGEVGVDDVLNHIFSEFCIGK